MTNMENPVSDQPQTVPSNNFLRPGLPVPQPSRTPDQNTTDSHRNSSELPNMGVLQFLLHGGQLALSATAGYHSYIAITSLQQYESASEKAAKISTTANDQLQMTRKTQAAGAFSILNSLASALYLAVYAWGPTGWNAVTISVLNAIATFGARTYMQQFWGQKLKAPAVTGYNTGIEQSKTVYDYLQTLTITWVASSVVAVMGW